MASGKRLKPIVDIDYRKWVVGDPDGHEIGFVWGNSYNAAQEEAKKIGWGLYLKIAEPDYVHYRRVASELAKKLHRLERVKERLKQKLAKKAP